MEGRGRGSKRVHAHAGKLLTGLHKLDFTNVEQTPCPAPATALYWPRGSGWAPRVSGDVVMLKKLLFISFWLLAVACQPKAPAQAPVTLGEDASSGPSRPVTVAPPTEMAPADYLKTTYWPGAAL